MKKTISIIESNGLFRRLIVDVVQSIGGYELKHVLVGLCDWEILLRESSDFLLLDMDSPCHPLTANDVIFRLTRASNIACIACTFHRDIDSMRRAFYTGAAGYVLKDSEYGDFRMSLELALCGGIPMSAEVARILISTLSESNSTAKPLKAHVPLFVLQVEEAVDAYLADSSANDRGNLSDYLSLRMHMSYGHISMLYREKTGVSLSRLRQERRISLAKDMLTTTGLSLTDIAEHLDFSSVAHLSASFRKITGLTPTEFRNASWDAVGLQRKDVIRGSRA